MHIYLSNLQLKNIRVISKLYAVIHVCPLHVYMHSVENKPKRGNTESQDEHMSYSSTQHQTVFQSGCHSHQQRMSPPYSTPSTTLDIVCLGFSLTLT